jgi:putative SOS response-associated peptidase YedK
MCGRYRLSRRKQLIEEYFATVSGEDDWTPRYNIAPTQPVPVIRQNPKEPRRELSLVHWGLIPSKSLQAAYGSHLRGQVAPRRRAETPATVEPAVSESLVGQLSRGLSQSATGHN